MKQYVGISLDYSASMRPIARQAMQDYNSNVQALLDGQTRHVIDTVVSVVQCGVQRPGSIMGDYYVTRKITNSNVLMLKPLTTYDAQGPCTPLWDSVGDLIESMSMVPDAADMSTSFMVMVITDGQENQSSKWSADRLAKKIKELQATDRWMFTFRVPTGYKSALVAKLGIPSHNVLEWDQTEQGFAKATAVTQQAVQDFYTLRATKGATSSTRFYADLADVKPATVKRVMQNVSHLATAYNVNADDDGIMIKDFIEGKRYASGKMTHTYKLGHAFYELMKTETIQQQKKICILDKKTQALYIGDDARDLLGIPHTGNVRVTPGNFGNYRVFVQSTSVNRKLVAHTLVMYFPKDVP